MKEINELIKEIDSFLNTSPYSKGLSFDQQVDMLRDIAHQLVSLLDDALPHLSKLSGLREKVGQMKQKKQYGNEDYQAVYYKTLDSVLKLIED